ncbi:hypothetical protein [Actinoalloteichus hymeniacidonis]|uniref:Uncharacterized protein n=1 Tax=Actinoalloteichus hymeniacidonis TaxID=340345 RepID=A0AAC9N170_9PSEU|nr:hypothetical protein [Actinoalloteichus hymeniacidonis]AOS65837.1 hypothetical protein TL08_25295 [Actinoalloteichus hymeniacidonis]MBB5906072.1 hypothetical protein [Actinoalloteichus hymeniacidonis]
MAKPARKDRIDPSWPQVPEGEHAVSELRAPIAGASSPFGDVEFPLAEDALPYKHPVTVINR